MKVEETYLDVLQNIESAIANEYGNNALLKDRDVLLYRFSHRRFYQTESLQDAGSFTCGQMAYNLDVIL